MDPVLPNNRQERRRFLRHTDGHWHPTGSKPNSETDADRELMRTRAYDGLASDGIWFERNAVPNVTRSFRKIAFFGPDAVAFRSLYYEFNFAPLSVIRDLGWPVADHV